jgi:hypothetical protein
VIAGPERRRDLRAGPARADRHAVPERLRQRDDVGRDLCVLEREPATGATEAGLHLVDDHERFALVAQPADAAQIFGRRLLHAALALNGLEQHGAHAVVHRGFERLELGERDLPEARRQRRERLCFCGCPVAARVARVRPWNDP